MERIIKYPRTPHLRGSRLQEGDEDLSQIPFSSLVGKRIAVEEKIDGANSAISFHEGEFRSEKELLSLLTVSEYISPSHLDVLREEAERLGLDPVTLLSETPGERWAEGLYVKVEEGGEVRERMKYVRHGFTQQKTSDVAWHSRPIVRNRLKDGISLY